MDSENSSCDEGGNVERVARTSKQILCICNFFLFYSCSLSIAYSCVIAFFALHSICYMLLASFILVGFPYLSKRIIEHLNSYLEEFRGKVLEPLIENLTSLLVLS